MNTNLGDVEVDMDSTKHTIMFKTMLLSAIAFGFSYLLNFFLAPYITKYMGADGYGYITLARNFSNYAAILTIALNSYAARYISVEYHRNNMILSRTYFTSVLCANVVLVGVILFISIICILFLDRILIIPDNLVTDTKLLFLMVFISFGITSIGTAFSASAYIKNRLDLTSIFKGVSYILEALTILLLYTLFGATLWFVGLSLVFAASEIFITNVLITKKLTPELKYDRKLFSINAVKTLVLSGIWNSINSLGNTLNTGLDLIVCNLLLTPISMGQLSYAKTIGTMFSTLYVLISQPFQPIFLKLYSENNSEQLIKEFKFSMKVAGFISGFALALFVALGRQYFKLWIPSQDTELIYLLTVLTITSGLSEGVVCPLYYSYTLAVKNKVPCIITIIGGICNVIGMYILIKYTNMGVIAVVVTTAVIMSIINLIFTPLYSAKCLKIKRTTFFSDIFRHLVSCGIMTMIFSLVSVLVPQSGWIGLIIISIIDCILGVFVQMIIVFNNDDRSRLREMIMKKVQK